MGRREFLSNALETEIGLPVAVEKWLSEHPEDPYALTLRKIYRINSTHDFHSSELEEVKSFPYVDYSIEEQIIYLGSIFAMYINLSKFDVGYLLLSKMKRLLQLPSISADWQVFMIEPTALLQRCEGDIYGSIRLIEICLQKLDRKSNIYHKMLWIYMNYLWNTFEKERMEKCKKEYISLKDTHASRARILYIEILESLEYGCLEHIPTLITRVVESQSLSISKKNLRYAQIIYEIFYLNKFDSLDENNPNDWVLYSTRALLQKNAAEALFWARKHSASIDDHKRTTQFLAYSLIRADLANGNDRSAEYSLMCRQKVGNTSILDNFFWFRVYHLRNKTAIAEKYARQVQKDIEQRDIPQRLKMEIRLSPELTEEIFQSYVKKSAVTLADAEVLKNKKTTSTPLENWMIGSSAVVAAVRDQVKKLASIQSNIVILGETGTGKDLTAKALHTNSPYHDQPFLAINCSAISDHLLQSELFGHAKGAFTGAHKDHHGFFATAKRGTVFLDEIGDISPSMQVNLLRVLENGEYKMLGDNQIRKIECKIIMATNRDLAEMVRNKKFRQDLYYRLERLIITLPPLRERKEDIEELCDYFLNQLNPDFPSLQLGSKTLDCLKSLPWHGNIRELRNEMEYIRMFHSDKKIIKIEDLSERLRSAIE